MGRPSNARVAQGGLNNCNYATFHLWEKPQRIAQEAAEAGTAAAHEVAGARDRSETADERADRHLRLHAGERHTGAGMDAGTEGEMAVGMAADVEPIGIGKLRGIAVGGA